MAITEEQSKALAMLITAAEIKKFIAAHLVEYNEWLAKEGMTDTSKEIENAE